LTFARKHQNFYNTNLLISHLQNPVIRKAIADLLQLHRRP